MVASASGFFERERIGPVIFHAAMRGFRDKIGDHEDGRLVGRLLGRFRDMRLMREEVTELLASNYSAVFASAPKADGEFLQWLITFLWEHREEIIKLIMILFAV